MYYLPEYLLNIVFPSEKNIFLSFIWEKNDFFYPLNDELIVYLQPNDLFVTNVTYFSKRLIRNVNC